LWDTGATIPKLVIVLWAATLKSSTRDTPKQDTSARAVFPMSHAGAWECFACCMFDKVIVFIEVIFVIEFINFKIFNKSRG
jgi:hypothetical protein